jgi:hypothetical protein
VAATLFNRAEMRGVVARLHGPRSLALSSKLRLFETASNAQTSSLAERSHNRFSNRRSRHWVLACEDTAVLLHVVCPVASVNKDSAAGGEHLGARGKLEQTWRAMVAQDAPNSAREGRWYLVACGAQTLVNGQEGAHADDVFFSVSERSHSTAFHLRHSVH